MLIKKTDLTPKTLWRRWFAWFPVSVSKDDLAWLQIVERRGEPLRGYDGIYWRWEYRLPEPKDGIE